MCLCIYIHTHMYICIYASFGHLFLLPMFASGLIVRQTETVGSSRLHNKLGVPKAYEPGSTRLHSGLDRR